MSAKAKRRTLWRWTHEDYGVTVTAYEIRRGGPVHLDYRIAKQRFRPSLGFGIRDEAGKIIPEREQRARDLARKKSAELRLGTVEGRADPMRITIGSAFALYHDEKRGGLPPSASGVRKHRRARKFWTATFGEHRAWNSIVPAEVRAALQGLKDRGMTPTADAHAKCLHACWRHLTDMLEIDGLKNPIRGLKWAKLNEGHVAHRPRFLPAEIDRLWEVRHLADPRFAAFFTLVDGSAARGKAVRVLRRSALDRPLDVAPSHEQAPHGWVVLPPLKGQAAVLVLLTSWQRAEIDAYLAGFLSELEAAWQADGTDYPLFPSLRKAEGTPRAGRPFRHVPRKTTGTWLHEAERIAGIPHVRGRGWHGLRRAGSDYLYEEIGLQGLTTAVGWSSTKTPEGIYIDRTRMPERVRARQAQEKRR